MMKKLLNMLLTIVIVSISGYLIISNIEHVIGLRTRRYTYDFQTGAEMDSIKTTVENTKNNISKIEKLHNSYLPEEEITNVVKYLNEKVEFIESLDFWEYSKEQNIMNEVEFFNMINDNFQVGVLDVINQYHVLSKHNESLNITPILVQAMLTMTSSDSVINTLTDNYQYRSNNLENINDFKANIIMINLASRINAIYSISSLVVESGELYE